MKHLLPIALAALGFVAGVGLTLAFGVAAPSPDPGAAAAPAGESRTRTIAVPADCDVAGYEARIAALEQQLAALQLGAELDRLQREGSPEPFPEDWGPEYRDPQVVRASAEAAARACGVPVQVRSVDCDEAPCIVWMKRLDVSDRGGSRLSGCEVWADTYAQFGSGNGSFTLDDSGAMYRYEMLGAVPPGWPPRADRDNVGLRNHARFDEGRLALMDAVGGRETTDEERIADLERQLGSPDLDEHMRDALEGIRERYLRKIERESP